MCVKEPWSKKGIVFEPTTVQSTILEAKELALNKQISARSKHKDLKYRFVKAALRSKIIISKDVRSAIHSAKRLMNVRDLPTLRN